MLASNHVVAALWDGSGAFQHGRIYLHHPVACAAALAVRQVIQKDALLEQVQASAIYLEQLLATGKHRRVGNMRGWGLFRGIELVADRTTKVPFDPALKLHVRVKAAGLARGLACDPGGTIDGVRGEHILLAPT